ncbi:NAD(P)-binding domain-containing protein [Janibacter sp. GS2]|uniref:NAD(P)-binding domain-containing protein n=1 Tax=Janibacter sp. GS2 TaxID=3442646 RepID=UPI003EB96456
MDDGAPGVGPGVHIHESVVIGAGQGGLSSSFHLRRLGIEHVVLDANDHAGGAWQHRWDSLSMDDVHGVADLPDAPAPGGSGERANEVVAEWFDEYEQTHELPVLRPVRVDTVTDEDGLLVVHAGERTWVTRTLINATGTWTHPFVPSYPGQRDFAGEQWHTVAYPGSEHFRGRRVVVVGGGASAVQFIGEIAPIAEVQWVTRREPVWSEGRFSGREAIEAVERRVREGRPPASIVSVTGLRLRPQELAAARTGVYERRRPMFERLERDGVRWADGSFERADAILWATGFRPAVRHLAPLRLRSPAGGIALLPGTRDVQTSVTSALDPRVQLVGYGPSASTIGGNRAGRAAALAVRRGLSPGSTPAGVPPGPGPRES